MDGFKVVSALDVEQMGCKDLTNEVHQLGILLYPPEVINENFMIKLRDCVVKLPDQHPLKRWMKWVAQSKPLSVKDQEKRTFLLEIINSQFNLITDLSIKNKIISLVHTVPETTLPEVALKSYLYLMIGNVTRSDNLLRQFTTTPPRVNWEKSGLSPSLFHKIARDEFTQILTKLSKHPADRRSFELFIIYLRTYYNDPLLLNQIADFDTNAVESNLGLRFVEGLSPSLVQSLKIFRMSEERKFKILRETSKYPMEMQSYWLWAFTDIDPLVSQSMADELALLEKKDELWFIYLMENEKLSDSYAKKYGKSFLPGRRPFLKEGLSDPRTFMLSVYKLIELGDINPELVQRTADQFTHE